jgi:hypothetical protein
MADIGEHPNPHQHGIERGLEYFEFYPYPQGVDGEMKGNGRGIFFPMEKAKIAAASPKAARACVCVSDL